MESEGKRQSMYQNISDVKQAPEPEANCQAELDGRGPDPPRYKNITVVSDERQSCVRIHCPKCDKSLESDSDLEKHTAGDCPFTMINCDFKHVGCEARLPRKALPNHLGQAVVIHLSQQTKRYEERIKMLEADNERLAVKYKRLETQQEELENKLDKVVAAVKQLNTSGTTLNGPKLRNYHSHDYVNEDLSLDLRGDTNFTRVRPVNLEPPSLMTLRTKQPCSSNLASVSSSAIPRLGADKNRYVNANAIHESLKNLDYSYVFTSKSQSNSPVPLRTATSSHCPVQLTMTNFEQHQLNDDHWVSQPFYTHSQGYLMCLRVRANGLGGGKGTHVTVGVYLMKGEFDDQLEWPFQGDITIELLNQESAAAPYVKTICRAKGEKSEGNGREKFISAWGINQFISYSELSPKYLEDDSLKFQISTTIKQPEPTVPQLIETEV